MRRQRMQVTVLAEGGVSTYSISGVVYDADGTTPVEGATVALGALSAVSAVDGTYTISDISAGASGSMTCTLAGYSWTAITIAAMSGSLAAQNYTNAAWAMGGVAALCDIAYKPFGAASYAASKTNLANPGTNDASTTSDPSSWDAFNGWVMDGVANYLRTGIIAATGLTVIVKVSDVITDGGYVFGAVTTGTSKILLAISNISSSFVYYGNGSDVSVARADMYGTYAVNGSKGYKNGVEDASGIAAWGGVGKEIVIGALNTGALSLSSFAKCNVKFFGIYHGISAAQTIAIMNAIDDECTAPMVTLPQDLVNTPAVIFHFDDNNASVYTDAYQHLVSRNAPIVMSVVTNNENLAIEVEKLHDQQDVGGFDFVNHTTNHVQLEGFSLEVQTAAIGDAQTWLNSRGFHGDYLTEPQASRDANTDTACANLGILTRTHLSASPYDFDLATVDIQKLNRMNLGSSTTLADAKAEVDTAKANNHVVIFMGHILGASAAAYTWVTQDFKDLVDYCITQDVAIITMHDLYRLRSGAVAVRQQV